MPNGQPDFDEKERPALEEFFAPFSEALADFSRRYNLRLSKYYHDAPSWSFTFQHPLGGVAKIDVERQGGAKFGIVSQWWYDDYDSATRSIRILRGDPQPCNLSVLQHELSLSLQQVLSWKFGEWDGKQGGYNWRTTWTKEQFQALQKEYPSVQGAVTQR